jgi:hypothetical protein
MGSPPSSHHRHITCAQSNALFPIGFATRKTISILLDIPFGRYYFFNVKSGVDEGGRAGTIHYGVRW